MRTILIGAAVVVVLWAYWNITGLRRNIALAKKTGLPYVIAPCSPWFLPWQLTHKLWTPLIKLFPESWWEPWLAPATRDFAWLFRHEHFAKHGDVFMLVSPGSRFLYVARAEAVRQITIHRDQFLKRVETYEILSQFGENVLTSEGAVWRMHRKVTSSSFNERNTALVFHEAIRQTQGMIGFWNERVEKAKNAGETETVRTLEHDTMRLALNIIGYAGFGLRLPWPNEIMPEDSDYMSRRYGSVTPPEGHKYSFVEAMGTLLENVLLLLIVPSWILRTLPFKWAKDAVDTRQEYEKYTDELLEEKIKEAQVGEQMKEGMDIMGQLVRSSYEVKGDGGGVDKPNKGGKPSAAVLKRSEIIGNAFVMLVAGHETTANAVHFTMLQMALNAASQRRLQSDIDELVGDTDPADWDYEELVNPMMASMLGACMNETLRVVPPVIEIPKIVTPSQDQSLVIDGQRHFIPKGTDISLCVASVHMNPRHWPTKPSKINPGKDDLGDFVPERWFRSKEKLGNHHDEHSDEDMADESGEDYGGFKGRDTSAQLFRPERGAYIPFSDGARACLGRRIAQVELIAALAVLFRRYSVELAVDEWASDEEVDKMNKQERLDVYGKAADKYRSVILEATSLLTLKLRGKVVPVRIVERGKEKFVNWMEKEEQY